MIRRAYTLVEAIAVMVILSVAVPAGLGALVDAAGARADAVNAERAATLACAAAEHVLADTLSAAPGLGFDALADENAYLTGGSGLYARLGSLTGFYATFGVALEVDVGPLVSRDGTATGDPNQDVFRHVTATARWTNSKGNVASASVGVLVAEL